MSTRNSSQKTPKSEKIVEPDTAVASHHGVSVLVGVVALLVYLATLHPSIPPGDSGELMMAATRLFVPHPPGYPLFLIVYHWGADVVRLLTQGAINDYQVLHVVTAVIGAATVGVLHASLSILLGGEALTAAVIALGWGFFPAVWTYATATEVFALSNLLQASMVYIWIRFCQVTQVANVSDESVSRLVVAGAVLTGLISGHQHLLAFLIIPVALHVCWRLYWAEQLSAKLCIRVVLIVATVALALYGFLFYLAVTNRHPYVWGGADTLPGLWKHAVRADYGTFQLHSGRGLEHFKQDVLMKRFAMFFKWLGGQFTQTKTPLAAVAAFLVVSVSAARHRCNANYVAFLPLFTGFQLVIFCVLANLPIVSTVQEQVYERFWMQFACTLYIFAAVKGAQLLRGRIDFGSSISVAMRVAGLALLTAVVWGDVQQIREDAPVLRVFEKLGISMLTNQPNNSVMLTTGDAILTSVRCVQMMTDYRTDVLHIDYEMFSYTWARAEIMRGFPYWTWPTMLMNAPMAKGFPKVLTLYQALSTSDVPILFQDTPQLAVQEPDWKPHLASISRGWLYEASPNKTVPCKPSGAKKVKRIAKILKQQNGSLWKEFDVTFQSLNRTHAELTHRFPWETNILEMYEAAVRAVIIDAGGTAQACNEDFTVYKKMLKLVYQYLPPAYFSPDAYKAFMVPLIDMLKGVIPKEYLDDEIAQ